MRLSAAVGRLGVGEMVGRGAMSDEDGFLKVAF